MARSALLVALVPLILAGCSTPVAVESPEPAAAPAQASALAAPVVDAKETLDELRAFAEGFPYRRGDNEQHKAARDHLEAAFREMGYETVFQDEYHAAVRATSTPTNFGGSTRLANVCAVKWGASLPQEWVVVGSHLDVTDGAVHGAYDDGSGTIIVQRLARAFAAMPTERTIVFCNFDGEEQGLTGSRHLVESYTSGDWVLSNGTIVGMIDFDMAGIMFPAAPPLVLDVRSPQMKAMLGEKAKALGIPDDAVQYREVRGGSSDNGPFKAAGIPSVLVISGFDEVAFTTPAGALPWPGPYPFWHLLDTVEGMQVVAGGAENLQKGFQNTLDLGSDLLFRMSGSAELTFE